MEALVKALNQKLNKRQSLTRDHVSHTAVAIINESGVPGSSDVQGEIFWDDDGGGRRTLSMLYANVGDPYIYTLVWRNTCLRSIGEFYWETMADAVEILEATVSRLKEEGEIEE